MIYFLIPLLLIFSTFSGYVMVKEGLLFAFPPFDNLTTTQIFWDLVISCGVCLFFIFKQRKSHKLSMRPFIITAIAVTFLGSQALLGYLIWDHFKKKGS